MLAVRRLGLLAVSRRSPKERPQTRSRARRNGAPVRLMAVHVRAAALELLRYPSFSLSALLFPATLFLVFRHAYAQPADARMAGFAAVAILGVVFFQFGVGIANERASGWEVFVRTLPLRPRVRIGARVCSALLFGTAAAGGVVAVAAATTPVGLPLVRARRSAVARRRPVRAARDHDRLRCPPSRGAAAGEPALPAALLRRGLVGGTGTRRRRRESPRPRADARVGAAPLGVRGCERLPSRLGRAARRVGRRLRCRRRRRLPARRGRAVRVTDDRLVGVRGRRARTAPGPTRSLRRRSTGTRSPPRRPRAGRRDAAASPSMPPPRTGRTARRCARRSAASCPIRRSPARRS